MLPLEIKFLGTKKCSHCFSKNTSTSRNPCPHLYTLHSATIFSETYCLKILFGRRFQRIRRTSNFSGDSRYLSSCFIRVLIRFRSTRAKFIVFVSLGLRSMKKLFKRLRKSQSVHNDTRHRASAEPTTSNGGPHITASKTFDATQTRHW